MMQHNPTDFFLPLFSGDLHAAEANVLQKIAEHGETAALLNDMGQIYAAQGRFSDALQYYDRAVCADSHFVEAVLNGAIILSDLGFYVESAARFEAACAMDEMQTPSPSNYLQKEMSLRSEHGTCGRRIIASKQLELASIFSALEYWDDAVLACEKACEVADSAETRLELARTLLKLDKVDAALFELEKARRLAPRHGQVHVLAALCYALKHNREEALDALSRAELISEQSSTSDVLRRTCDIMVDKRLEAKAII